MHCGKNFGFLQIPQKCPIILAEFYKISSMLDDVVGFQGGDDVLSRKNPTSSLTGKGIHKTPQPFHIISRIFTRNFRRFSILGKFDLFLKFWILVILIFLNYSHFDLF